MNVVHLTPGTGHFFCGSCLRDKALVTALRARGHDVTMVPLYLPLVVEDGDIRADERVFLGGVNMYLQQKIPLFRYLPDSIARRLDSPRLLRWLSSKHDMTDAAGLGAMVVSTLEGASGRQSHEVDKLVEWMATVPRPDVLCLSNVMLIGLAARLKDALGVPVICTLQGEAPFLDALSEPYRTQAWSTIAAHVDDIDAFVPVSRYYADVMRSKLDLPEDRVHVVPNGIDTDDFALPARPPQSGRGPTIGYLARMCVDKGLHTLVDAFLILKRDGAIDGLKLLVAGVMLEGDHAFVDDLRDRIERAGFGDDVEFRPNITRDEKLAFLASIDVLSVPATYGESFGLYVLEALAAGVPVVQPRHGAFPELIDATGGGHLCEADDPASLADGLGRLLADADDARAIGARGRAQVLAGFTSAHMALGFEKVSMMVASCPTSSK